MGNSALNLLWWDDDPVPTVHDLMQRVITGADIPGISTITLPSIESSHIDVLNTDGKNLCRRCGLNQPIYMSKECGHRWLCHACLREVHAYPTSLYTVCPVCYQKYTEII